MKQRSGPRPSGIVAYDAVMPSTTNPIVRLGSTLLIAAAVAACSSPAASNQPASQASSAAPTTIASEGAPPSATSATPAASVVVPSLGADTPLVDILPAELGGEATQRFSFVGSDLSALDPSAAMIFGSISTILKVDGADMTIGTAANSKASVIAVRVKGKSAQEISDAMVAGRTLNATTTKDELDLGGKHVLKVTTTIAPLPFYVYATGDVSLTVAGADETIVAEALSKLP
jgi:hypothetical protein